MLSLTDIQSGADWWVSGTARFPDAQFVETFKSGIITQPLNLSSNPLDESSTLDGSAVFNSTQSGRISPRSDPAPAGVAPGNLQARKVNANAASSNSPHADDQPVNASVKAAMLIALLQNPGAAVEATGPSPDRAGLLSLLTG
jgi:hypothetical protein